jgi:[ribosomal protein S5]-alanine N-acetyltransferase
MLILQTARLILRDFIEDDWHAIYALSHAPTVTQYQTWLRLPNEAAARQWIHNAIYHNQLEPRHAYNLAIVNQQQVIGWIGWGQPSDRTQGDYDFGYALLPSVWGHGYMTEALDTAITYMFEMLNAERIVGECASSNESSARVMEKVGMLRVATWNEQNDVTGMLEEQYRYALAREDWIRLRKIMESHRGRSREPS